MQFSNLDSWKTTRNCSRTASSNHAHRIIWKLFDIFFLGNLRLAELVAPPVPPKTTKSRHSLHSSCSIKYIARGFPKKADRLSSRKSSLHGGGGLFKLKRRQQQQQVGPQTGRQTDVEVSSRRHCRPRGSATMPHRKLCFLTPECDRVRFVRAAQWLK